MGVAVDTSERIARLRQLMSQRGYDAVIVRNIPDLRWLTGAAQTFDEEVAHVAFITEISYGFTPIRATTTHLLNG